MSGDGCMIEDDTTKADSDLVQARATNRHTMFSFLLPCSEIETYSAGALSSLRERESLKGSYLSVMSVMSVARREAAPRELRTQSDAYCGARSQTCLQDPTPTHNAILTRCRANNRMAPPWISVLASIGMAVGPPLVYVDQTTSIIKKKYVAFLASRDPHSSPLSRDSTGFARDVCAVLCANHALFMCLMTNYAVQAACQYYSVLLLARRAL